jgi:hypothetical protein
VHSPRLARAGPVCMPSQRAVVMKPCSLRCATSNPYELTRGLQHNMSESGACQIECPSTKAGLRRVNDQHL